MELHDLGRNRGHRPLHPRLLLRPVLAPHPGYPGRLTSGVPFHRSQLIDRYVQLVATGVGDDQVVPLDTHHRPGVQSLESPYPVLVVHDMVSLAQVAVLLGRFTSSSPRSAMGTTTTRHLPFPENGSPEI